MLLLIFKNYYNYWSLNSWSKGAIFGTKPTTRQRAEYLKYLQAIAQRKEKPLEWVEKHMELEFGWGQVAQGGLNSYTNLNRNQGR